MKNYFKVAVSFASSQRLGRKQFKTWLDLSLAWYMSPEMQGCLAGLTLVTCSPLVKHASESRHKRPGDHFLFCSQAQVIEWKGKFLINMTFEENLNILKLQISFLMHENMGFHTHSVNRMQFFSSCVWEWRRWLKEKEDGDGAHHRMAWGALGRNVSEQIHRQEKVHISIRYRVHSAISNH